jgi:hypothetical protein
MMSFREWRLAQLQLPVGTVWLLTGIAEAKGRQALYTKQAPQVMKALRGAPTGSSKSVWAKSRPRAEQERRSWKRRSRRSLASSRWAI